MHWIRQQRLELARQRLIDPADQVSVTQIAFSCGFTQLGIFARLYRQRFGETPSATLDQTFGR